MIALLPLLAVLAELPTLEHNDPDLVVDLHAGLWAQPIPCDYDGDGDVDLLVNCPDKPIASVLFYENPGPGSPQGLDDEGLPIFRPPVRLGPSHRDLTPSYSGRTFAEVELLARNQRIVDLATGQSEKIYKTIHTHTPREKRVVRANQFSRVDFDGDGDGDLITGIGDWEDYGMQFSADSSGWSNAYSRRGQWQPGPLRGWVYVLENTGSDESPKYAAPTKLEAGDGDDRGPIDTYGRPAPNFADFDGDGDLDLVCGEFLDGFTYFQNVGSRTEPRYAAGQRLQYGGADLTLELEMIVPVAFDWNDDGHPDLVVGDEDGRVALVRHTGQVDSRGVPRMLPPVYFQQQAGDVFFGALVTPAAVDWDGDGDTDLISGNSAGFLAFIENRSPAGTTDLAAMQWAEPRRLQADGQTIRFMAGPAGSVQGPSEVKWGYTTLSAADWNGDTVPDLVVNSIWGKVVWIENLGTREQPILTSPRSVRVAWSEATDFRAPMPEGTWWRPAGDELVTQWRTTPVVVDWNDDDRADLVMLDHEGYLALWLRRDDGRLDPPRRIFRSDEGKTFDQRHRVQSDTSDRLRLNTGIAGRGGRVKLTFADWDGDGHRDLLVNSENITWMKGQPGDPADPLADYTFTEVGPLSDQILAGHTTSPTVVNWDGDAEPELVIGAEDGRFYYLDRDAE